jgi:hypothetical protein
LEKEVILVQPQRLFVGEDTTIPIVCPSCGKMKMINVTKFKGRSSGPVKIRCTCKKGFSIFLEFRKTRRKETLVKGYYTKLPQGKDKYRMHVKNLCMAGIHFTTWDTHNLQEGDQVRIQFVLDDKKGSHIERVATVRWVRDNLIGCEFTDGVQYHPDLGFYFTY